MKKPIRVFFSTLSCRFYASSQYKMKGNIAIITGDKFDVTDDIAVAIQKHDLQFYARETEETTTK